MGERRRSRLVLEDGAVFEGTAFGADRAAVGEVVFSTGIAGYPETLTDPSYHGQILVLTYPLIGNYGVPEQTMTGQLLDHFESERIQIAGLVVSALSREPSHWTSVRSLDAWLRAENIPAIEEVDTRALTQRLRSYGITPGRILPDGASAPDESFSMERAVAEVSVDEPRLYRSLEPRGVTVGILDCGVKTNMIRLLMDRGADVLRLPWDADPLETSPRIDGLLISNGPGDPKDVRPTVQAVRQTMERGMPTFGICLGNQLMALAAGADTYKLPFGHRGQNQPCLELGTDRCYITSQNHGYAVDEKTLPPEWEPWFRNANDGTNEGIRHRQKPFSAVQFHPEAHPGPEDMQGLIDLFIDGLG